MKTLRRICIPIILFVGLLSCEPYAKAASKDPMPVFSPKARILFQGDSITDGNRGRNNDLNHILGHGYQFIIACKYGAELPERNLTFMNRGVSGNRVSSLARRLTS